MARMSIGAAFSESFAFLKANWMQMLTWIGGALLLLCVLGYLMLGNVFSAMAIGGGDPTAALAAFSRMFLFSMIAAVILYAACMLIWRGGLYPGEGPKLGWAFQAGPAFAFGMFVVMVASYIVILIIGFILMLIFGAALGAGGGFSPSAFQSGAMSGWALLLIALFYIGLLVFMLWVQARFSVAGPVMADRLTRNPVTGLVESWRLTRTSQWTIVAFYIVFAVLMLVYVLVAGLIGGGLFGVVASSGSMIGTLVTTILSAVIVYLPVLILSFSVPVGLYRALAPRLSGDVFA